MSHRITSWRRMLGWDKHPSHGHHDRWWEETRRRLLPAYTQDTIESAIPPLEVTKIAVRLHHLVEECIPCEIEEERVTVSHSKIITPAVIAAAKGAGGDEYRACVVYCLLICKRWFYHQSIAELWDASMHQVRGTACEVLAKQIIEGEDDMDYLLQSVLLKRYSILVDGEPTLPSNVIEKAVDLHALRVIGSSGYQKCIAYLWRGWLVQDENDPSNFVDYKDKDNTSYTAHLDPDRMRAPVYQNAAQMLFSILYLALLTIALSTMNRNGDLDGVEILLYIFTLGFLCDELTKIWKAGYYILGFWDAFNGVLYALLITSLALRFVALGKPPAPGGPVGDGLGWGALDTNLVVQPGYVVAGLDPATGAPILAKGAREHYNELSYNFLAFSAPMFWIRLLLYLDSFRFFGAMLVVLKVMMKESVIFFALLIVILLGFLQAFIGLDYAEDQLVGDIPFIVQAMANAVMQSPDFAGFEQFGPPFGIILYYCFTFIVMVVLLNILIALYNSAYEDIYENADDEYLALFAQKTMQFVRAPDENVFIPPLNLIEIFCLALPFEWWLSKHAYERLNDIVMAVLYAPLLVPAAYFETRIAREVRSNRRHGEDDDDTVEEWEQLTHAAAAVAAPFSDNSEAVSAAAASASAAAADPDIATATSSAAAAAPRFDLEADGWHKTVERVKPNVQDDPAVIEVRQLRAEVAELKTLLTSLTKAIRAPASAPETEATSTET